MRDILLFEYSYDSVSSYSLYVDSFIHSFILFCSSNQQSQPVAIHNELDRKATKH